MVGLIFAAEGCSSPVNFSADATHDSARSLTDSRKLSNRYDAGALFANESSARFGSDAMLKRGEDGRGVHRASPSRLQSIEISECKQGKNSVASVNRDYRFEAISIVKNGGYRLFRPANAGRCRARYLAVQPPSTVSKLPVQ